MKFKGSFLIVLFSISVLTVAAASTQWYEYEEKAREQALREWCKDNDVAVDE